MGDATNDTLDALDAGLTAKATPPDAVPRLLADLLAPAIERMEARATKREKPIPLPWPHLAEQFGGGLWPGLHVLTSGTGAGKTTFALQAAVHAARAGVPVLYIGLEMGELDLVARLLGEESGVPWSDLFLGRGDHLRSAKANLERLRGLPLHIEHGAPGGWPYSRLTQSVEAMRARYPQTERGGRPMLVVLDFLQIVGDDKPDGRALDLRERIGRAAYAGRHVATTHDAAVLLVSSAARSSYALFAGERGREVGDPGLTDDGGIKRPDVLVGLGKESGEIEYAADTVTTALRWPELLDEGARGEGRASIMFATAKVRHGRAAWCELRFNGWRFTEPHDGGKALRAAMKKPDKNKPAPPPTPVPDSRLVPEDRTW